MVCDQSFQAHLVGVTSVEAGKPGDALLVACGDPVEVVLQASREVVVHEPSEMLLEQLRHREREKGRDERGALLEDVAAVDDGAENRRVRRWAADTAVLKRF